MPEDKGLGSKLLGLFVEKDDRGETPAEGTPSADGEKSAAELVEELARGTAPKPVGAPAPGRPAPAQAHAAPHPVAAEPALPPLPKPSSAVAPATVDFDAVFKSAGLDPAELDRVRKAEELLKGLPEATPVEVRRQIVEASLKAFGVDVTKIAGAARTQLKALETWGRLNEQQTAKSITDMQAQIAQLEDKVIGLKADITKKTETLAALGAAAEVRRGQVNRVLDFFAQASPPPPAGKP